MHRGRFLVNRGISAMRNKSSIAASSVKGTQSVELELGQEHTSVLNVPFARAKLGPFFQAQPRLGNQFLEDPTLQNYLKRFMPEQVYSDVSEDLTRFGARVAGELYQLHLECEQNQPWLRQFDAYGKRVDEIVTCAAWKKMKGVSAEEGLIAIAYERKHGEYSRMYQVAKMYLFSPSSGFYTCPLAMTDGAAKTLEVLKDPGLMDHAYKHLVSRDPTQFWTSGQWMTERRGGSDVANGTETLAIAQPDGSYKLYGYKWFTSATDSDMTLTLARVVGQDGQVTQGTRGLAMFYLEVRDQEGQLNNMEVQRLKDKLGTRQVPTAELLLDGTKAFKVSPDGRGVPSISSMLEITRLHNTTGSATSCRRIINLARDYSTKRECFGKIIKDHKLHIRNLANMEVEARSATLMTMEIARFLGRDDCEVATEHEHNLIRILTPLAKLYTAKQAMAVVSEGLECFGGVGYLEDSGLPSLLRDAQVLPIWEGTTNILSLDVLRAMAKTKGECLKAYHSEVYKRTGVASGHPQLGQYAEKVLKSADSIVKFASENPGKLEVAARDLAFSLSRTYMGMLMLEAACWSGAKDHDVLAAKKWCEKDLTPVISELQSAAYTDRSSDTEYQLVYDGYQSTDSKL